MLLCPGRQRPGHNLNVALFKEVKMVFSSNSFLFLFLPVVLLLYYAVRKNRNLANALLTVMSLVFYAWGETKFVFVMLISIFLNWLMALGIEKYRSKPASKLLLIASLVMDIGLLGVFKYTSFIVRNLNSAFSLSLPDPELMLPIGISFFTFQAMSYVIDVYRGKGKAQRRFVGVCLYISFFPQLIAGPIVRYETVADEIMNRCENKDDFIFGCRRFLKGLCKKVLIANGLSELVDYVFAFDAASTSLVLNWVAAACYLMQVYYDFSGYSDMAIGLGRMFGFHFLENFNMPFISKSVTEFWRRWHISMCTWFRDYVFFPLGGSRVKSRVRAMFNMFVVWALTGLWHGAEWTFILWGVGFFVIQAIEKLTGLGKWMERHAVGHFYAMLVVVVITVLIRCDNISAALEFYHGMFVPGSVCVINDVSLLLIKNYLWVIIAAVVFSLPLDNIAKVRLHIPENVLEVIKCAGLIAASFLAVTSIAAGGYSPFIYFNF